ncbi:heavy metal transport/detoxification protein [Caloranaerobacter sp. TR13]|uniref:heavy-metal-associated domain-containing protein n=1 Tax=Caloranaerobacter sp. TR13 TaxID=1302151 RepID=UPI0006D476E5|nr:cation transporter [Caloranaerobacter sp. TR13]KPU27305.1 heavy metal transport/detoxification protein [Caloranaerobacter sp. TR13]
MKKTIVIEGMTCGHCAGRVKKELENVCGVKVADVDVAEKKAVVELAHEVDDSKLAKAVEEAGYKAVSIE